MITNVTKEKILNSDNDIKFKYMSKEEIIISIDRLTRFKFPEIKYLRVFKDILSTHLISPSIKKNEIEKLDFEKLKSIVELIINSSLEKLGFTLDSDFSINQKLYDYENSLFNITDNINILLKNKIHYKSVINLLEYDLPYNLKWLKTLNSQNSPSELREKYSLVNPIEKVILVEGITEEILLPRFAKVLNCDFDKKGFYIISAGGKKSSGKILLQICRSS
jgi:hypothetical protein